MSNFLSTLGYGATVAIIGILIVFFVLALLIICIYALGAVMQKLTGEKKAPAQTAAPAPAPVAVPAPVVEEPVVEEVVDDAELIAVIAAAIAAFDNSGKTLVVRKVRRVSAWNKSSRQEQVTRF
jgi:sodium pump decarboxylase gamma subunit